MQVLYSFSLVEMKILDFRAFLSYLHTNQPINEQNERSHYPLTLSLTF